MVRRGGKSLEDDRGTELGRKYVVRGREGIERVACPFGLGSGRERRMGMLCMYIYLNDCRKRKSIGHIINGCI